MFTRALRRVVPAQVKAWLRRRWPRRRHKLPRGMDAATSFGALVDGNEAWLLANLPEASARYHWDIFLKTSQKRLARRLGLEVAHDYLADVTLDEALSFVEDTGLDRFVIKPNSSHSGIACRMMIREGPRFRDLLGGRRVDAARLRRELREEQLRGRPDAWVLEELLLPVDGSLSVIEDYKFPCFGGVAELITHRRKAPGGRKRWLYRYDREWNRIRVGRDDAKDDVSHVPANARRLLEVAEGAASRLCYPFIRLDLYDTSRGIVLGEFTPGPGHRYGLDQEWNARYVRRWHEAADAILEGIRSGRITPLAPEAAAAPPDSTGTQRDSSPATG